MTDKLKTLKDLEFDIMDDLLGTVSIVNAYQLREAAIKWIKRIKEKRSDNWDVDGLFPSHSVIEVSGIDFRDYRGEEELQGAIKMFKHFFNINEEELDIR